MTNISNNAAGRIGLTKSKGVILGSVIVGALALPLIAPAGSHQRKSTRGTNSSTWER